MLDDEDVLGPIDHLAVEFVDGRITGDGFAVLLDGAEMEQLSAEAELEEQKALILRG